MGIYTCNTHMRYIGKCVTFVTFGGENGIKRKIMNILCRLQSGYKTGPRSGYGYKS